MSKKLLRKKLALMLANLKKKRKYYCEVEYLETTNQQTDSGSTNEAAYIDTGIVPNNNTRIECRMQFTTLISGQSKEALNGTTGTSPETNFRFAWGFAAVSPYTKFYFGLGAQNLTTSVTRDTNVHTFVLDAKNKTCSIDDTTNSFTSSGSIDSTRSIYLFARHSSQNYANKPCNARIYRYRNWNNEQLVQDLIPVLDWNYTPCMYDRVSGQLFYNAGTGSFTYGREIHYVDYIQTIYSADGNAFIDTGYYPNFNTKVEFMASGISADTFAGSSGGTWFTGGRQAYQQKMFGSYYNPSSQNLYFCFSTTLNLSSYSTANMYGDNKKFVLDKTGLYINDTKVVNNTDTTNFTSPATLAIFGLNNNGAIISPTGMKIQYYKVWDNGVLTRDYIPMIDENGVGALFDKVTHTIYDAVGEGTGFKYPPVEMEYLQSSGTQYIDTGFNPTSKTRWEYDYQFNNTSSSYVANGMFITSPSTQRFAIGLTSGASFNMSYGADNAVPVTSDTDRHMFIIDAKNMYWQIDNSTGTYSTQVTASLNRNIYFFARNGGSLYNAHSGKLYGSKIYDDGILVRDFIPCYKDGVACMVDKLTGTAYLNQGTGDGFTTGKIVEPEYE